ERCRQHRLPEPPQQRRDGVQRLARRARLLEEGFDLLDDAALFLRWRKRQRRFQESVALDRGLIDPLLAAILEISLTPQGGQNMPQPLGGDALFYTQTSQMIAKSIRRTVIQVEKRSLANKLRAICMAKQN